jgi:hypothetical protein
VESKVKSKKKSAAVNYRSSARKQLSGGSIEHAGWTYNDDGKPRSSFEERPDYFSSAAFWYQKGVNEGLPEPPFGEERLPLGNASAYRSTRGSIRVRLFGRTAR